MTVLLTPPQAHRALITLAPVRYEDVGGVPSLERGCVASSDGEAVAA